MDFLADPLDGTAGELEDALAVACGYGQEVLLDFIGDNAIVRRRSGPRTWKTVTRGEWSWQDLQQLQAHGLLTVGSHTNLGWEIHPRPELLGAA